MLAALQGLYYFVFGLWPIVYMPGFLAFTGPKDDIWLVRTVGWLLAVSGIVLISAAIRRRRNSIEVIVLAMGNAAVLAGSDTYYALTGQIGGVYLLDSALEVIFLIGWLRFLWHSGIRRQSTPVRVSDESIGPQGKTG